MTNRPGLSSTKDRRRKRLAVLFDTYGQAGLAAKVGIAGPYLWQMAYGEGKSARGVSDENAAKIEAGLDLPEGYLDAPESAPPDPRENQTEQSQPVLLNPARIQSSIRFLESQFGLWDKEFILDDRWELVAMVYEKFSLPAPPNRIELSQWLADHMTGEENERERKAAGSGKHDRGRNEGRAPSTKTAAGRTK